MPNYSFIKENNNFMISLFQINADRYQALTVKSKKGVEYSFFYEDLVKSKTFWISSIYIFLSITLLTGLHMYEYFKCFLC